MPTRDRRFPLSFISDRRFCEARISTLSFSPRQQPPLITLLCNQLFTDLLLQPTTSHPHPSKQPHPRKHPPHAQQHQHPHLPPDPRPLRHPQHPPHRALQPRPCAFEGGVDVVGEFTRVADLVADRDGELFELRDFGGEEGGRGGVILGLEGLEDGGGVLASAGMILVEWDGDGVRQDGMGRVEVAYFRFGVAGRNPPSCNPSCDCEADPFIYGCCCCDEGG